MTSPFLTVQELAGALNIKPSTVYAWTCRVGSDSIPRVRLGKRYGFDLQDVVAWLKTSQDPRLQRSPARARRMPARIRRQTPARDGLLPARGAQP